MYLILQNNRRLETFPKFKIQLHYVPTVILGENFETSPGVRNYSLPNWTNYATAGTKNWTSTGTTNKNARFFCILALRLLHSSQVILVG